VVTRTGRVAAVAALWAGAVLMSAAPVGAGTTTTSVTTTTTPAASVLAPPRHGRWTILEIGDSLGTDLGGGLLHQLSTSPKIDLVVKSKSSTGLSNTGYYNWPQHLKEFLAQYHPQLTIFLLGGNDEQGIEYQGHGLAFNTPAWRTQYAKNVASMMFETTRANSAALWIGMPIMAPNGYRQGMQVINSIFKAVAATNPRVTFLPTWSFFANPRGEFRYSGWVDGRIQVIRQPDGIHPTAVGQNVLATYVVSKLHTVYGLPARAAYPQVFAK